MITWPSHIVVAVDAAPDVTLPFGRLAFALVVVLGLLAAAAWLLRRTSAGRRTKGGLAVEAALPLGERRSLAIVAVEGRRLLIGLAPNHVALVTELQKAEPFSAAVDRAVGADRT